MSPAAPTMSVVLVTPDNFATLRRTVRYLRDQTVRDRLEILLVGPDDAAFRDLEPSALAPFAGWRTFAIGPIEEVERAFAPAVVAATTPLVALLENHVYPDPGWAAALIRAHEGPWTGVGSIVRNANPQSATSWVAHFLSYGLYHESARGGETVRIARNNSTFKRAALLAFGNRLADVLARDGGLLDLLRDGGHRFYLEPAAQLEHLNPSRPGSELALRFLSARASAATRVRIEGWSTGRRLLYILACPLLPAVRLRGRWDSMRRHPASVLIRVAPFLTLALVVDAVGQAVGFATGAGDSAERAGHYDLQRHPHLSATDQARFAD